MDLSPKDFPTSRASTTKFDPSLSVCVSLRIIILERLRKVKKPDNPIANDDTGIGSFEPTYAAMEAFGGHPYTTRDLPR